MSTEEPHSAPPRTGGAQPSGQGPGPAYGGPQGDGPPQQGYETQAGYGYHQGDGNQGSYGTPAGYAGPGGYGQPGSYGNQGGYSAQAGYGNQGGYASPGGYGNQGGYGNPQGYGPGPYGYAHAGGNPYAFQGGRPPEGRQPGKPVGPVEAVTRFYAKYTQFSGRASRSEYWWAALYLAVIYLVLSLLMTAGTDAFGELNGFGVLMALLLGVFALGHVVPSIAIGVRRLHDVNLSGWFYLLGLVPYVGGLVLFVFALLPPRPEGARFDR